MKTVAAVLALVLVQTAALSGAATAKSRTELHPRPPSTYAGQWYTTPGGCSYSRAQAPGYPVSWHLILNPRHIGQPGARRTCPIKL